MEISSGYDIWGHGKYENPASVTSINFGFG